jgi:NADPH-dependent glutamate synthase beta subunit-like oxidoreductase/NAD(P)H-flavin reductase
MGLNTILTSPLLSALGLKWADCAHPKAIAKIDQAFLDALEQAKPELFASLVAYRQGSEISQKELSLLLNHVSLELEQFIAELIGIENSVELAQDQAKNLLPLYRFKKEIIQTRLKKRKKEAAALADEFSALDHQLNILIQKNISDRDLPLEIQLALLTNYYLEQPEKFAVELELIAQWCLAATANEEAKVIIQNWQSFQTPEKLDYNHLIDCESIERHDTEAYQINPDQLRQREGFSLTDKGLAPQPIMDEAQYCVFCHQSGTDYCSRGFLLKKSDPTLGFKKDPHGGLLVGCPLEEKISEMNWLYHIGQIIAPLAIVMLDNPMCPATGYRICNDCMKSCIYQKQKPVDIPAVETDTLKRVLDLPWGAEIYWLLTLWSPLAKNPIPESFHNTKVLVMGMGPAGFTLSHYLLRAGYAVVGMDGLKITPMDREHWLKPVETYQSLEQDLDKRQVMGFGGVAEYGITSRWNKNFLSLIYLTLVRQPHFQCFGSVRFGGTMTIDRAWELGFDHLAIAVGAGLPKELPIENSMVNGMRQANDFLMALQLTGAGKKDSLASLQVRLPAVVIGGGLTGVDAATECQAYYLRQIERTAQRYQDLCHPKGENSLRAKFSEHDLSVLDEQLQHANELQIEREQAKKQNREADTIRLIRKWGGVSIVYRKAMQQSPAYRLNHEELHKALEEGLYYVPHCQPTKVLVDDFNDAKALVCESTVDQKNIVLPAKTLLVATGAKPNIAYAFEHRGELDREGYEYSRFKPAHQKLEAVEANNHVKSKNLGMLTSYQKDNKRVSFLGDAHRTFHGSVVKAIASAKKAFESIDQLFTKDNLDLGYAEFSQKLAQQFDNFLVSKQYLKDDVLEIIVHAPEAAKHYHPGVIYKLQTYDHQKNKGGLKGQSSESVALGASAVKDEPEQLRFLMKAQGTSTELLAQLQQGDRLVVMGPTGVRTTIAENQAVMIIGGFLAFVQLQSLLPALKAKGNQVYFFGCFKKEDVLSMQSILDQCDAFEISVAEDWASHTHKLQTFINNCNQIPLFDANTLQMRIIGYDQLLLWIKSQRQLWLDAALPKHIAWVGSVYGPMQCMLKGVCAQCLQWQIDPETGKRTKAVYACSWQDQPFEKIDIMNIEQRLSQNHMQERLHKLWYDNQT